MIGRGLATLLLAESVHRVRPAKANSERVQAAVLDISFRREFNLIITDGFWPNALGGQFIAEIRR